MSIGQLLSSGETDLQKNVLSLLKKWQLRNSSAHQLQTSTETHINCPWPSQVPLCPASPGERKSNLHEDPGASATSGMFEFRGKLGEPTAWFPSKFAQSLDKQSLFLIQYSVQWSEKAIACSSHLMEHIFGVCFKNRRQHYLLGRR